ncbi:hypothetical protein [Bifidobacterium avesanii]|uniref:hypothetical protein n=1 Tax=Bifidobacterium avesanii TaxID=1798157 RepID=UPI001385F3F0|nr:hypothetical protein [Bifidobacterium avesanii]KAB8291916.1 hypothetical protein DSM100685_1100 [Bifidobacterium avesanii]
MDEHSHNGKSRTSAVIICAVAAVAIIAVAVAWYVLAGGNKQPAAEPTTPVPSSQTTTTSPSSTGSASTSAPVETPSPSQSESSQVPSSALAQTDASCNPHNTFNAEDPSKETLVYDESSKSLTLLSGSGSDFSTFSCVADALQMPAEDRTQIEAKADQPVQQTATWNNLTATWSYNQHSGLNLYVTEQ